MPPKKIETSKRRGRKRKIQDPSIMIVDDTPPSSSIMRQQQHQIHQQPLERVQQIQQPQQVIQIQSSQSPPQVKQIKKARKKVRKVQKQSQIIEQRQQLLNRQNPSKKIKKPTLSKFSIQPQLNKKLQVVVKNWFQRNDLDQNLTQQQENFYQNVLRFFYAFNTQIGHRTMANVFPEYSYFLDSKQQNQIPALLQNQRLPVSFYRQNFQKQFAKFYKAALKLKRDRRRAKQIQKHRKKLNSMTHNQYIETLQQSFKFRVRQQQWPLFSLLYISRKQSVFVTSQGYTALTTQNGYIYFQQIQPRLIQRGGSRYIQRRSFHGIPIFVSQYVLNFIRQKYGIGINLLQQSDTVLIDREINMQGQWFYYYKINWLNMGGKPDIILKIWQPKKVFQEVKSFVFHYVQWKKQLKDPNSQIFKRLFIKSKQQQTKFNNKLLFPKGATKQQRSVPRYYIYQQRMFPFSQKAYQTSTWQINKTSIERLQYRHQEDVEFSQGAMMWLQNYHNQYQLAKVRAKVNKQFLNKLSLVNQKVQQFKKYQQQLENHGINLPPQQIQIQKKQFIQNVLPQNIPYKLFTQLQQIVQPQMALSQNQINVPQKRIVYESNPYQYQQWPQKLFIPPQVQPNQQLEVFYQPQQIFSRRVQNTQQWQQKRQGQLIDSNLQVQNVQQALQNQQSSPIDIQSQLVRRHRYDLQYQSQPHLRQGDIVIYPPRLKKLQKDYQQQQLSRQYGRKGFFQPAQQSQQQIQQTPQQVIQQIKNKIIQQAYYPQLYQEKPVQHQQIDKIQEQRLQKQKQVNQKKQSQALKQRLIKQQIQRQKQFLKRKKQQQLRVLKNVVQLQLLKKQQPLPVYIPQNLIQGFPPVQKKHSVQLIKQALPKQALPKQPRRQQVLITPPKRQTVVINPPKKVTPPKIIKPISPPKKVQKPVSPPKKVQKPVSPPKKAQRSPSPPKKLHTVQDLFKHRQISKPKQKRKKQSDDSQEQRKKKKKQKKQKKQKQKQKQQIKKLRRQQLYVPKIQHQPKHLSQKELDIGLRQTQQLKSYFGYVSRDFQGQQKQFLKQRQQRFIEVPQFDPHYRPLSVIRQFQNKLWVLRQKILQYPHNGKTLGYWLQLNKNWNQNVRSRNQWNQVQKKLQFAFKNPVLLQNHIKWLQQNLVLKYNGKSVLIPMNPQLRKIFKQIIQWQFSRIRSQFVVRKQNQPPLVKSIKQRAISQYKKKFQFHQLRYRIAVQLFQLLSNIPVQLIIYNSQQYRVNPKAFVQDKRTYGIGSRDSQQKRAQKIKQAYYIIKKQKQMKQRVKQSWKVYQDLYSYYMYQYGPNPTYWDQNVILSIMQHGSVLAAKKLKFLPQNQKILQQNKTVKFIDVIRQIFIPQQIFETRPYQQLVKQGIIVQQPSYVQKMVKQDIQRMQQIQQKQWDIQRQQYFRKLEPPPPPPSPQHQIQDFYNQSSLIRAQNIMRQQTPPKKSLSPIKMRDTPPKKVQKPVSPPKKVQKPVSPPKKVQKPVSLPKKVEKTVQQIKKQQERKEFYKRQNKKIQSIRQTGEKLFNLFDSAKIQQKKDKKLPLFQQRQQRAQIIQNQEEVQQFLDNQVVQLSNIIQQPVLVYNVRPFFKKLQLFRRQKQFQISFNFLVEKNGQIDMSRKSFSNDQMTSQINRFFLLSFNYLTSLIKYQNGQMFARRDLIQSRTIQLGQLQKNQLVQAIHYTNLFQRTVNYQKSIPFKGDIVYYNNLYAFKNVIKNCSFKVRYRRQMFRFLGYSVQQYSNKILFKLPFKDNIQRFIQHDFHHFFEQNQIQRVDFDDPFHYFKQQKSNQKSSSSGTQVKFQVQPFPFKTITYMLLVQAWLRFVQQMRWSKLNLAFQHSFQTQTNLQAFIRQAHLPRFKLVVTPQFGYLQTVRKVTYKRIETSWYDAVFLDNQQYDQVTKLGYNYQSGRISKIFQYLYEIAQTLTNQFLQLVQQLIFDRYNNQSQFQWGIKYVSVFCQPAVNYQNFITQSQDPLIKFYNQICTYQMVAKKYSQPWFVFSKQNRKIKGQCQEYAQFSQIILKQNRLQAQLCYSRCLMWLHYVKKLIPRYNYQQIKSINDAGLFTFFLDLCLRQYGLGYSYKFIQQRYQIGSLPYMFWICQNHVTLIQTQKFKWFLQAPKITSHARIRVNQQPKMDNYYQKVIQQNFLRANYDQQKLIRDMKQQYKKQMRLILGQQVSNIPSLWQVKDIRQFALRPNSLYVDIQCTSVIGFNQACYLCCCIGYASSSLASQFKIDFWDTTNFQAAQIFIHFLYRLSKKYKYTTSDPLVIWTFNGNNYQMMYFLPVLIKVFKLVKLIGQPTAPKGYSVDQGTIIFKDACLLLGGGSLSDQCKTYDTLIKKNTKQQIDISFYSQIMIIQRDRQNITKYCYQDCFSLMYLVHTFFIKMYKLSQKLTEQQKKIHPMQSQKIKNITMKQLTSVSTAPSMALLIYKKIFVMDDIIDNQPTQWKLIQRSSYTGGISLVTAHKVDVIAYSYDINSSYPASMIKKMPWRWRQNYTKQQIQLFNKIPSAVQQLSFFVLQSFQFGQTQFPCIPVKTKKHGMLYFRSYTIKDEKQYICIWGFQLKAFLPQAKFKIIKGCQYDDIGSDGRSITSLKQYVLKLYPMKSLEKDQSIKTLIKLLLNSLYGKFGQKRFTNCTAIQKNYAQISGVNGISSYQSYTQKQQYVLHQQLLDQFNIGFFVRIAHCITSRSKLMLAQACNYVKPRNVLYVDTDSITVNSVGKAYMQKSNLIHQSQLGKWKLQAVYQSGYFIAPKTAILKIDKVFSSPKIVSKAIKIAGQPYLFKWKGVPRRMLIRNDLQAILAQIQEKMEKILSLGSKARVLQPYPVVDSMFTQRWVGTKYGITVQLFYRKTNFILKRKLVDSSGKTIPFIM